MANIVLTQDQVSAIVAEAFEAARQRAEQYFQTQLGGRDQYPCGFAWCDIYDVRGNTKLGKMLAAAGVGKNSYTKTHQMWNPAKMGVQNMNCLEAGAAAAAEVFRKYGFKAYAGSRMD